MRTPARLAAAILAAALCIGCQGTTLELTVRDSVSKAWVWSLTARVQDRAFLTFFQSDAGPTPLRFTQLLPGDSTVILSAPGYQSQALSVRLSRGPNALGKPVEMVGLEIPNLHHWIIFENAAREGIVSELRPVGADGKAVINHPCLDLWVGCRVFAEMKNGIPAQQETEAGVRRGRELFSGKIPWRWDPAPETLYRYHAFISAAALSGAPPLLVIDYLIVVPDPRHMQPGELDRLMEQTWGPDPRAVAAALDRQKGRLAYYSTTSWNVKAAAE